MRNKTVHAFRNIFTAESGFIKPTAEMFGNASVLKGFLEEKYVFVSSGNFDGFLLNWKHFSELEHGSAGIFRRSTGRNKQPAETYDKVFASVIEKVKILIIFMSKLSQKWMYN